jgi:hypothetical protein
MSMSLDVWEKLWNATTPVVLALYRSVNLI